MVNLGVFSDFSGVDTGFIGEHGKFVAILSKVFEDPFGAVD